MHACGTLTRDGFGAGCGYLRKNKKRRAVEMILLNICEWVSVPDPDIVNCPLYVFASDVTVNAGTVSVQGDGITGTPRRATAISSSDDEPDPVWSEDELDEGGG
ncbi:hypothetical protein B0H13DRAFT_1886005 [Mycena leptocephala]|nr:hypothetical protein B0H13DRAFT_1886005 [Mycena leptocephala]